MRDEDRSQQDVVYHSPRTTTPVYHTDRSCRQLQSAPVPIAREEAPDRWRECERCKYADIPALGDRAQASVVLPWVIGLWSLLIILTLFVSIAGGLL
jgi:hypothetical protein